VTIRSLLLCSRPPWPALGGDRLRTAQISEVLAGLGPVDLVTVGASAGPPPPHFARTRIVPSSRRGTALALGRGLLAGDSLQEALYATDAVRDAVREAAQHVDVVVAHLLRTVPWLPAASPPVIVCLQDAIASAAREAHAAPGRIGGWRRAGLEVDAARLAEAEERALSRADGVTFITARDRDLVLRGRDVPSAVVPAGVTRIADAPNTPEPDTILFAGNLRTASNQDMAVHLARVILPLVRSARPDARLDIAGIEAPSSVTALGALPGVRVVGPVDDMHATVARAWVSACPLRFGSGVQNKVLESMAAGTPVVGSARVAESLGPGSGLVTGSDERQQANALIEVLSDRARRDALGAQGIAFVRAHHAFPAALAPLPRLIEQVLRAR